MPRRTSPRMESGVRRTFPFRKILILVLSLICAFEIWYLLRHSSWFSLQSIDVQGEHYLSKKRVVELSGLRQGMLIFEIRFSDVVERMREEEPILKNVRILQLAPNRLQIRVQEREARYWLKAGDRLIAMADDGVFLPLTEDFQPPRIEIELTGSEEASHRLEPQRLRLLKAWVGQLEHSVLVDYSRLKFFSDGSTELIWADVRLLVENQESFHRHAEKIRPFLKKMKQDGQVVQYIDLRFDNMVVNLN